MTKEGPVVVRRVLNDYMDRLARAGSGARREALSAFRVCGYAGLGLAVLLTSFLILSLGLPPPMIFALTAVSVVTFMAVAAITKIIVGGERLVFYHHALAVVAAGAALSWALGQPVLRHLDVLALGVGIFHACGRLGCLMAGCCHGRPHEWGIAYGAGHAAEGLPAHLVGVRLFPVQAAESLWILLVVLAASAALLGGAPPGSAFTLYVLAYSAGRFFFEFARGDASRPYLWGFSEAQWTSLGLVCAVALAELSGAFPLRLSHVGAALVLLLALALVSFKRTLRGGATHMLTHPRHVREIARVIDAPQRAGDGREQVNVKRTSLGLLISTSRIETAGGLVLHYALSSGEQNLNEASLRAAARIILRLKPPTRSYELIKGSGGVFHLLSE
jgi:hypothetical protein